VSMCVSWRDAKEAKDRGKDMRERKRGMVLGFQDL
jgi:hypothetical protein